MKTSLLPRRTVSDLLSTRRDAVCNDALSAVSGIVADVRERGEPALREYATAFGEIAPGAPLHLDRAAMLGALDGLPPQDRARLERVASRIGAFAEQQRGALAEVSAAIPGGAAGHRLAPIERVGCYVPGGRYPLFSSLLMTAIPARVAGVTTVWVASPRPGPLTLAAAAVAGADGVLAAGGAQAIAALAYGCTPVPSCDMVVGPGNRYVTAAKHLVSRHAAIDMLAGPSELVVLADDAADPALVAADLLAQAEHDPDAIAVLVALDDGLVDRVEVQLALQLEDLPTASVARAALGNGGAVVAGTLEEAIAACDRLAPEHLHVTVRGAEAIAPHLRHFGTLFLGSASAPVLGDYGAGPNHVLPTGGTARFANGLSVLSFLRVQTWMRIGDPESAAEVVADAEWMARQEGLEAHARSSRRAASRRGAHTLGNNVR